MQGSFQIAITSRVFSQTSVPRRYFRCGFICFMFGAVQFLNFLILTLLCESRKKNPHKLTQLSPRSHPRHLVGKKTAQEHTIIDITSDSQANSYFPYRWSPASLTINIYFYLFLRGWSGGAMVLGKLSVPEHPTYLD